MIISGVMTGNQSIQILIISLFLVGCSAPEGSERIVFVSDRDGNREIYAMDGDGSNQSNLTNHPAADFGPTWSPDQSRIAFKSTRDRQADPDIYVMKANGSDVVRITAGLPTDFSLSWSPTSDLIAFTYYDTMDRTHEIGVIDADGSNFRLLTTMEGIENFTPSWSPDGKQLLYVSNSSGTFELWSIDVTDSNVRQITDLDLQSPTFPELSPKGNQIVVRQIHDRNSDLYLLGADGTSIEQLTSDPAADWGGVWSRNGEELVFNSNRDGDFEIYKINVETKHLMKLTDNNARDNLPDL